MAELRKYWALSFPATIHILLCTSALLSIVTTALSLASKPIVSVMIVIFPSLTFLTLLHHGFVLVIARKKEGRRESPKIVSKTLVRKRHIYALCFLSFFWLTGTAWAVPIAVRSKSRVHVANEAIGLLELLVLLSVLVICIKDRGRIWRERLDGKVNDIESNSNGIPMQSLNKSKADNVTEISDEENAKPEAEPEQRSDQEGGGSTQVPEADQSPTTEGLHTVIEYTEVTISTADGTQTHEQETSSASESAKPAEDKKVVEDDGVLNKGCNFHVYHPASKYTLHRREFAANHQNIHFVPPFHVGHQRRSQSTFFRDPIFYNRAVIAPSSHA